VSPQSFNIPLLAAILLGVSFLAAQGFRVWARRRRREMNTKTRDKMVAIVSTANEYVPVDASSVEGLNQERLTEYTAALEQLGFSRLLDYRLRRGDSSELRGFERVLANSEEHCFAGIMAVGALQPDQPLFVAINSYMDGGWWLGTSNIPARKADYYLRHPRILRMRYPDDPIERLVARYLERRGEILRDLDIKSLPDVSIEFFIARSREANEERKTKIQTSNPLGDLPLAEAQATARTHEWLGDYPAEAERRRAHKKPVAP
jgi:hypothetical protein